jgi:prepilin-type processing-associated H-X9-DG protein
MTPIVWAKKTWHRDESDAVNVAYADGHRMWTSRAKLRELTEEYSDSYDAAPQLPEVVDQ